MENEMLSMTNLLKHPKKPLYNEISSNKQSITIPREEGIEEEDGETMEEEKTTKEDEDGVPQPSTAITTTPTTITTTIQFKTNPPTASNTNTIYTTITTTSSTDHELFIDNKLLNSNRRHPARGLPTTIHTAMEISNQSSMATLSNTTRLQNTVCKETDSINECEEAGDERGTTSYQCSSSEAFGRGDDRNLTITEPRLSLQVFHPAGESQETSYLRLPEVEQLHPSRTFMWRSRSDIGRLQYRNIILKKPVASVFVFIQEIQRKFK